MAKTSAVALPLKALLKKYASGTDDVTPGSVSPGTTPSNQSKASDLFPASNASEDNLYTQWKTGNPFSIAGALARDQVAPIQDAGNLAVQGVSRAIGGLVNGFTGTAPSATPSAPIRAVAPVAAAAAPAAPAAAPVSASDVYLSKLHALSSLFGGGTGLRDAIALGWVRPDATLGTPQESAAMQQFRTLQNNPQGLTVPQYNYYRLYGQVAGGMNPYNLVSPQQ